MITSTSRSLLGPISPLAAEPQRITRRGWTASTMRLTSSSMACGSGYIIDLLGSIMFDCLIGYYQTTDFGCIWAGLHSHPQSRLPLPGDKSVARVLMLTLALFLPITLSIIALTVLIVLALAHCTD